MISVGDLSEVKYIEQEQDLLQRSYTYTLRETVGRFLPVNIDKPTTFLRRSMDTRQRGAS